MGADCNIISSRRKDSRNLASICHTFFICQLDLMIKMIILWISELLLLFAFNLVIVCRASFATSCLLALSLVVNNNFLQQAYYITGEGREGDDDDWLAVARDG